MSLLERARSAGVEFRIKGVRDFQYKKPTGRHVDLELLAEIGEHRDELLAELRAELPKTCAKCDSTDIGPGGVLCVGCTDTIARSAFDVPHTPERWQQ